MRQTRKIRQRAGGMRLVCAAAVLAVLSLPAAAGEKEFAPFSAGEAFTAYVLTEGLDFPWEMLWGPDGMLWVTERHGRRITRIDPATGDKMTAAEIPDAAAEDTVHEGILGMAFGPGFLRPGSENLLYVYYTLREGDRRWGRLAAFRYDEMRGELTQEAAVLDHLPAGSDHNAGRLRLGPDSKLYLTIGEQGHNQGEHYCLPIEAQRIPSVTELQNRDWDSYRGKSLRIDLDGGIPEDNPVIRGIRSHVFTYGHRNPQGLVFVGNDLYSCEQGPSSDDEINLLEPGGNYGWPHVAGFRDGMGYAYANYSAAANCPDLKYDANVIPDGVPVQHEMEWFAPDFKPPLKTFYTVRQGYDFSDSKCGDGGSAYICWPTVAPSSVIHYPAGGPIPSMRNSLLVTTLKAGKLLSLPLSGNGRQLQGEVNMYFRSPNRYRAAALSPDAGTIYIATDSSGSARDDDGRPAARVRNGGSILAFRYEPDAVPAEPLRPAEPQMTERSGTGAPGGKYADLARQ